MELAVGLKVIIMSPLAATKDTFKKSMTLRRAVWRLREMFASSLCTVSPGALARYRFKAMRGTWPNLRNPRIFDEKLLWLMLYWRHPLKTRCGDKYTVRLYVEEHGLGHVLPKLLGVYETVEEVPFEALPERFALKCTHGCKCNIICKDKRQLQVQQAKQDLRRWMRTDYSKIYGELHYAGMKPRIICEPFLDDLAGELPSDYKVYCFGGRAHCTMACTGRALDGHHANYDFYDREWEHKLPYDKSSVAASRMIAKPSAYEEIIEVAEQLSKPFPFVRMDFYSIGGRAVLGEMTFTPSGCIDTEYTDYAEQVLGDLIKLPQKLLR